jgi:DNA invertase Pin-like site-specific DNA recombinase
MWVADIDNGDIGYSRVSSEEQGKTKSIQNQEERLKEFGCTRIYSDIESAYSMTVVRQEFQQLRSYIESGQAKGRQIVLDKADRLARWETVGFEFLDLLAKHNLRLYILESPHLDNLTPEGRQLLGYEIVNARAQSAKQSRRIKAGHDRRRKRGGAYNSPFGYKRECDKHVLNFDPVTIAGQTTSYGAIARDVIDTFLELKSLRATVKAINRKYQIERRSSGRKGSFANFRKTWRGFDYGSLVKWLRNPILRGHTCYGCGFREHPRDESKWDITYNTHPDQALITEAEYRQISGILESPFKPTGKRFESKAYQIRPLSPIMRCGICNHSLRLSLQYRRNGDPIAHYYCANARNGACRDGEVIGTGATIRAEVAEAALIEALKSRAEDIAAAALVPIEDVEPLAVVQSRHELAQLRSFSNQALVADAIAKLESDIEHELKFSSGQIEEAETRKEIYLLMNENAFWGNLLLEEKREIYQTLCRRLVVVNGSIKRVELF